MCKVLIEQLVVYRGAIDSGAEIKFIVMLKLERTAWGGLRNQAY